MSAICTHYADKPVIGLLQFVCDTVDEVKDLPTTTTPGNGELSTYKSAPMGSTCTVGNGGATKVYMLFTDGWQEI